MLNYDDMVYGTYRLSQVLRNKITESGQTRTAKVGHEEGHSLASRKNEPMHWKRSSSACRGWCSWC